MNRHDGRWAVPPLLDRAASWSWRLVAVTAAVYVLLWLVSRLQIVVVAVFVAVIAATALDPAVSWLHRRGVPRLLASWMALLAVGAVLAGVGWLVVPRFVDQLTGVEEQVREGIDEGRHWLEEGPLGLSADQLDRLETGIEDQFSELAGGAAENTFAGVLAITEAVTGLLLSLVLTFFFVNDGRAMWRWLVERLRPERQGVVDAAGRRATVALRGWVRGVAVTGVVDGLIIGVGLVVIGVPLAFALAVLTFFAAFLPIVGAVGAGALAVVVAFVANGATDAILVALLVLAVQQIEGDLVLPLVMSRSVALHPAAVLVALAIGGAVAGIIGAVVAVPVAAALVAIGGVVADAEPQEEPQE